MHFGITNVNIFFDGWWTLFIIIPCFIGIFKEKEKTGNIICMLVGIALLLCCQNVLDFNMVWKLVLPAVLVAIGISFIFKDVIGDKVSKEIKRLNEKQVQENSYCATFAGQNINFDNQEFKGVELTAVFGGIKIDLRKAIITEDTLINVSAIFGGVDIFVPENVQVRIKSVPIFGGVSDKSSRTANENSHIIYINAQCVFGGVEIR